MYEIFFPAEFFYLMLEIFFSAEFCLMLEILFLAEIWLKLQSDFNYNLTCEK